jgi:4-amino-4-deoxy-L-arabinose transferase-like glycosyltransferase
MIPISSAARKWLALAFVIGIVARVAILTQTRELTAKVADEQHYRQIAENLSIGRGFALAAGHPTSIRPPLYPVTLAGVFAASGDLQAVRFVQILLALMTALVVFVLAARIFNEGAAVLAASIAWLYPSLLFFNFLILTETLFTLLLMAFLLCTVLLVQTRRPAFAIASGVMLGCAALTRSVLWPVPLLLCPLLPALISGRMRQRAMLATLVLVGHVAVLTPWAVRNTRLQHVTTIVDTMGGMNLRMGNYEFTPEDRMWDAVDLEGEKNWAYGLAADFPGQAVTEGQKDKWAQRKAVEFIAANPRLTLRRSLIKFADFWGLEREFPAAVQQGLYTPPRWFAISASAAILFAYVAVAVMGAVGMWLAAPADKRLHVILLMPVLLITAAHALVFGHSRYHLPLMPIMGLYASALVVQAAPAFRVSRRPLMLGAMASVAILVSVWIRQVVITDFDRIRALLSHVG